MDVVVHVAVMTSLHNRGKKISKNGDIIIIFSVDLFHGHGDTIQMKKEQSLSHLKKKRKS